MSDILKDLLKAYYDRIDAEKQDTLSYIRHHAIVAPPLPDLSLWYGELPVVLIQAGSVSLTPSCFEGAYRSNIKHYTIVLTGALEYFDDHAALVGNSIFNTHGAVDLANDIETLFDRESFGLSQTCTLTSITYNQISLSQVPQDGWIHTVDLVFDHLWMDRRLT